MYELHGLIFVFVFPPAPTTTFRAYARARVLIAFVRLAVAAVAAVPVVAASAARARAGAPSARPPIALVPNARALDVHAADAVDVATRALTNALASVVVAADDAARRATFARADMMM